MKLAMEMPPRTIVLRRKNLIQWSAPSMSRNQNCCLPALGLGRQRNKTARKRKYAAPLSLTVLNSLATCMIAATPQEERRKHEQLARPHISDALGRGYSPLLASGPSLAKSPYRNVIHQHSN